MGLIMVNAADKNKYSNGYINLTFSQPMDLHYDIYLLYPLACPLAYNG